MKIENIIYEFFYFFMIKLFINEWYFIKRKWIEFYWKKIKKIDNNNKIEKKIESICLNVVLVIKI